MSIYSIVTVAVLISWTVEECPTPGIRDLFGHDHPTRCWRAVLLIAAFTAVHQFVNWFATLDFWAAVTP